MKRIKWLPALLLALAMLAGCSGLSYEDLYTLPQAPEAYYDLQAAMNRVLEDGYSYLSPTSGVRREPVQLVDLNGDGVDEAVAFFRSADRGEVKVYIFAQRDTVYDPAAVIDGAGSAVASVEYADLDGSGNLELIITYQVSETVTQALQVYRYVDEAALNLLTTGCSRHGLGDLDGNGLPELVCMTDCGADLGATIECYGIQDGELGRFGEQRLRFSYDNLRQVQWGVLQDGRTGIVCSGLSSASEGLLMTDVFVADQTGFTSVETGEDLLSFQPIHSYYAYPEDIDRDGFLEFPGDRQLPAYDEGSNAQWVVDWYGLRSDGTCERKFTAYHNFGEGWYLQLLDPWTENLVIKASDESTTVSTVTLYRQQAGDPQEILTIYTLRGAQRQTYAEEHSLTILRSDSDNEVLYAVTLAAAEPWDGTATMAQISELFHFPETTETQP